MRDMTRLEILEMASNMLEQAKIAQKSIEEIMRKTGKTSQNYCKMSDSLWAKHVYRLVRTGVSIIEITTKDLKVLSEKDFTKPEEKEEEKLNEEDEYEEDY